MTDDKWEDSITMIQRHFTLEEQDAGVVEDPPNSSFQSVVFSSPAGRFKVTRTKRPRVLNKHTQFAKRAGGETKVDYEYAKDEFVDSLEVFQWDDSMDEWGPVTNTEILGGLTHE